MTQRKRNEHVFGEMMREYGYYVHKWGDVRYGHCPKCNTFFPLPKAEKKPDFLVAMTYRYVEAKGAGDIWTFADDFRPNQREFMDENHLQSWIFVEMGSGKAPKGKSAFLMPWSLWKFIENQILEDGHKSIRLFGTTTTRVPTLQQVIPENYFLEWANGKWHANYETHPWWRNI